MQRMPPGAVSPADDTHFRTGVLALLVGGAALVLLGVGLVVTTRDLWGFAAATLGLAALAAGAGYVLGGRRRPCAP
jgi:hypothetical protein